MSGPKYTEADYEKVMAMPAERYSLRDVERATGVSMFAAARHAPGRVAAAHGALDAAARPLTAD